MLGAQLTNKTPKAHDESAVVAASAHHEAAAPPRSSVAWIGRQRKQLALSAHDMMPSQRGSGGAVGFVHATTALT